MNDSSPPLRKAGLAVSILCALCLAPAGATHAADRKVGAAELAKRGFFSDFDELDLSSLLEGDDVRVSVAARREEPLAAASGTVTLVTAEEIHEHGFRTLEEVLRAQPGFDVLSDGLGRGHIVVRGAPGGVASGSSEGVLILLDGHRLNEDLHGGATLSNLAIPVDGLARIEILRGPASALYGEGAAAAVIHLVSERPSAPEPGDPRTRLRVSAGHGSFDQQHLSMELGGRLGEVGLIGLVHYGDSSGARLSVPADAQTVRDLTSGRRAVSLAPGRTKDDVRTLESLYRLTYKDVQVLWRMKQEQSGGFIGAGDILGTQNRLRSAQLLFDVLHTRKLGEGTLRTTAGLTRSRLNELLEVLPPGFERVLADGSLVRLASPVFLETSLGSVRVGVESLYDRPLGDHDVLLGVGLERESTFGLEASSNLDFQTFAPRASLQPLRGALADAGRTSAGLWGQDVWRLSSRTTLTSGARLDHVGDVGLRLSPRLVASHALPRDVTLRLMYSRAYRAPSFRELAFDLPTLTGNPDLEATSLQSVEVSAVFRRQPLVLSGSLYRSWLRNPVRPRGTPAIERPAPLVNDVGSNITGLELLARRELGRHAAFVHYSFQDADDAASGRPVAGVSGHVAALGGSFVVDDRTTITPHWLLRTSRPRAPGDPRPALAGYGVVNVAARRLLLESKRLELRGVIKNLLDQSYRDPSPAWGVPGDYPRPGRSLYVDARYRF